MKKSINHRDRIFQLAFSSCVDCLEGIYLLRIYCGRGNTVEVLNIVGFAGKSEQYERFEILHTTMSYAYLGRNVYAILIILITIVLLLPAIQLMH